MIARWRSGSVPRGRELKIENGELKREIQKRIEKGKEKGKFRRE
jgi:hypothetical protein